MSGLEGRTINHVRRMTAAELTAEAWEPTASSPLVLVLDDGTKLYAARDPEGNGPGTLFGVDPQGRHFALLPERSD